MAAQVHVNDVGVVFRYTLVDQDGDAIDVSSATTKTISFTSPGGATTTVAASFTTDGSDGVVEVRTFTPTVTGLWRAQVYIAGVSGFTGRSELDRFPVLPNLG
jgi:hypothetical protein